MADKKITQFTAATTPLTGTEVVAGVQGAGNVKILTASIAALAAGSGATGTGFVHMTADVVDSPARAVDLASSDVTNVIPALINAQTGTSYTILSGDQGKLVTMSNGSSVAVTLPQATGSFTTGYSVTIANKGVGVVTITPTTSTIDGQSSVTLNQYQSITLVSDGTNYSSARGVQSGGGGSGDWVSPLANTEVAITTTATATISKQHVASGTSADYTITLPAASGNGGKFVGIRIAPGGATTKLITIDGASSETIDGALTRIMWAGESCLLYCDGSNWFKVAGKTIPMYCVLSRTTDQTLTASTWTAIALTAQVEGTPQMYDSGSSRVKIVRPGRYYGEGDIFINGMVAGPAFFNVLANATVAVGPAQQVGINAGGAQGQPTMGAITLAVNDFVNLAAFGDTAPVAVGSVLPAQVAVTEIISW